jgi:hypothetical protein
VSARPLRIAFDLSATRLGQAGVARTALQLADALAERADVDVLRIGMGSTPAAGGPCAACRSPTPRACSSASCRPAACPLPAAVPPI